MQGFLRGYNKKHQFIQYCRYLQNISYEDLYVSNYLFRCNALYYYPKYFFLESPGILQIGQGFSRRASIEPVGSRSGSGRSPLRTEQRLPLPAHV